MVLEEINYVGPFNSRFNPGFGLGTALGHLAESFHEENNFGVHPY